MVNSYKKNFFKIHRMAQARILFELQKFFTLLRFILFTASYIRRVIVLSPHDNIQFVKPENLEFIEF